MKGHHGQTFLWVPRAEPGLIGTELARQVLVKGEEEELDNGRE